MAIGTNRPKDDDDNEPSVFGLLARWFGWAIFGLVVIAGVIAAMYGIHRLRLSPAEQAVEDNQSAIYAAQRQREDHQQATEQRVKDAANAKAHWADFSRYYAQDRVTRALKDPDSAQFRSITVEDNAHFNPKQPGFACGKVNAKNSFGGYTGFKDFMVIAGIPMVEDGSGVFVRLWKKHCMKNQL